MDKQNNTLPPWSDAPDWANYIRQQPEGDWYAFSHKPFKTRTGFSYGHTWGVGGKFTFFVSKGKPNLNWWDTLEKRPSNE